MSYIRYAKPVDADIFHAEGLANGCVPQYRLCFSILCAGACCVDASICLAVLHEVVWTPFAAQNDINACFQPSPCSVCPATSALDKHGCWVQICPSTNGSAVGSWQQSAAPAAPNCPHCLMSCGCLKLQFGRAMARAESPMWSQMCGSGHMAKVVANEHLRFGLALHQLSCLRVCLLCVASMTSGCLLGIGASAFCDRNMLA